MLREIIVGSLVNLLLDFPGVLTLNGYAPMLTQLPIISLTACLYSLG